MRSWASSWETWEVCFWAWAAMEDFREAMVAERSADFWLELERASWREEISESEGEGEGTF